MEKCRPVDFFFAHRGIKAVDDRQEASNSDPFKEILAAARDGDANAIGTILQECRDYLLLIANQDLDNDIQQKIGASDLVQESMMTAQACFKDFEGTTRDQLLGWLRGILSNDLKHWRRHYKGTKKRVVQREQKMGDTSHPWQGPTDSMFTPSTNAANEEEEAILKKAIAKLPENYQSVIELRNWQDRSFAQIGQSLGCSADAARKLWSRAIIRLQEVLSETLPDLSDKEINGG